MEDRVIQLAQQRNAATASIQALKVAMAKDRNIVGRKINDKCYFVTAEAADNYFGPMIEDAQKTLDSIAILPEGFASAYDMVTVGPIKFSESASQLAEAREHAGYRLANLEKARENVKIGKLPEPPKDFWYLKDIYA